MRSIRRFAPALAAVSLLGLAAAASAQAPTGFNEDDAFQFIMPDGSEMPWSSIKGPLMDLGSEPSPDAPASAPGAAPVGMSGYNQDVIWDGTAADAANTGFFDAPNGYAFYSVGALPTVPTAGLPLGTFLSATGSGATYQLQSPQGDNALMMTPDSTDGALTLATPGAYQSIALLSASSNGGSTVGGVFSYTDGTTTSFSFTSPDWYNGGPSALATDGRVSYFGIGEPSFQDVETGNPCLYEVLLAPDATKTLAGIDFSAAFTSTRTATGVFAVSGVPVPGILGLAAAPEPSQGAALALGALGLAGLGWKARRRAAR